LFVQQLIDGLKASSPKASFLAVVQKFLADNQGTPPALPPLADLAQGGSLPYPTVATSAPPRSVPFPADEAVIICTFKHRGIRNGVDVPGLLRRDLRGAGVDLDAAMPNGKPRVVILTWGNHTALSEYAYCQNVVIAGVMHRSDEDLTGAAIGQTDDLLVDIGGLISLEEIKRGEIANILYQALSRGSCRFTENGKARPMNAWIVHHDPAVRPVLDKVMPGAVWRDWRGSYGAGIERKTYGLAVKMAEYLRGLSPDVQKISSRQLKEGAGLGDVPDRTFTKARQLLAEGGVEGVRWTLSGRSFVRSDNPFLIEDVRSSSSSPGCT
jgi:hypothetical protein